MHAGQGLVAFARGVHDQLDYAIKFILNLSLIHISEPTRPY